MAEPCFSSDIPSMSSTHKRSFDDMDPELGARLVETSRRDSSVGSSSSPGGSRERSKRPRNDSESEVDELLVSSNTSVSSSGSSSSLDSYHSARSSFTDISPQLLPADDAVEGQLLPLDDPSVLLGPVDEPDVPMDDILSFVSRQDSIPPQNVPSPLPQADPQGDLFRMMERADAFNREISALRQSPVRTSEPLWQSWTPSLPDTSAHESLSSSFNAGASFGEEHLLLRNRLSAVVEQPDEPPSRPDLGIGGETFGDRRRRLSTYERDAARQGDIIGRSRARQELLDQLLADSVHTNEPETSPPHISSPRRSPLHQRLEMSARVASPRAPPAPSRRLSPPSRSAGLSELHSFVDGFWRRENDRDIQDQFERTMRDTEAHSERVADFLAESGPSRSSFSTLRGALDERHINDRTHPRRGHRPPSRPQPNPAPRITQMAPRQPAAEPEPSATTSHWTTWEPVPTNPPSSSDYLSMSLPSSTTPQQAHYDSYGFYYFDDLSEASGPLPMPQPTRTRAESYLEASRDRSVGLSNLRHRARPPQRTPTPPPSPPSPRIQSTEPSFSYRSEVDGDRRTRPSSQRRPYDYLFHGTFTPRTPTDDAMLQSFTDHLQPPNYPPPPALPSVSSSEPSHPDPAPQPRQYHYGNFDLSAYREGPFRATLARSMALQGQSTNTRERASPSRTETREHGLRREYFLSLSSSEEDDDGPLIFSERTARQMIERMERSAHRRAVRLRGVPPQAGPPVTSAMPQASDDNEPEQLHLRTFDEVHSSDLPSRPPPLFRRVREHSAPQNQIERLRELVTRPTVTPPPPTRHRTLLERERAPSHLHGTRDNEPSTRSSGLDRWEQRLDTVRRVPARRAGGPDMPSSTLASSLASRLTGNANEGPSLASARQRAAGRAFAYRPPSPPSNPRPTEGRTEQRAPLNGRFARARGLASHFPPDMVWVDFPSARLPPYGRRRNIGDYIRDEDMDMSYEGLLSLSTILGDVKPRGTPADIISSLPKGTYGDWVRPGVTEERCPICLDDYDAKDACLRVPACSHWFHEGCLQQWLKTARTCPVCRGRVTKPRSGENSAPAAGASGSNNRNDDRDDDDDSDRDGARTPRHWTPFRPPWRRD
ncbi:hypothetical protein BD310DRAFT_183164 [Dichomitus squalens]|uniref:RING-type domain-containing protein n=1 Tax=Dichomitus squalens TaxID=114155 RepID=A0A4Q9PHH8_9APHY|nr:hypothetical protein BD310DRAFT_183164 [Dichomitus squalens]